ncbi:MAG: transporter substrate-binding domain-containing protein [Ruminococcaceae bacterium]|nr:transporter substrate-binding domain-containing protein [Oscillospiraceae bacterium]
MKKIIALLFVLALSLTLLVGCGGSDESLSKVEQIKKDGKLVIYTNAEFPPFEYIAGGKPTGVDIDICQAIADELGVKLEVKDVEFDSIVASVKSGKADLGAAGITVTTERQEEVDFTISYTTSKQYVILPESVEYKDITTLKNMKIGVQLGTTGDFVITDEINGYEGDDGEKVQGVLEGSGASVTQYPNANVAAVQLTSGKIDAVVIDKLPAELIAKNNEGLKAYELVYEDGSNTEESYAICVAKGNEDLVEVCNKVIQKLLDEGKIDEFIIKHSTEVSE